MKKEKLDWLFATKRSFWLDPILNAPQKALCAILASHGDLNRQCWPTHAQLCHAAAMTDRTLRKHLDVLQAKGFIAWINCRDQKGRSRCVYTLLPPSKFYLSGRRKAAPQFLPDKQSLLIPPGFVPEREAAESPQNITPFRTIA